MFSKEQSLSSNGAEGRQLLTERASKVLLLTPFLAASRDLGPAVVGAKGVVCVCFSSRCITPISITTTSDSQDHGKPKSY